MCSSAVARQMGFPLGMGLPSRWGACSMNLASNYMNNKTKLKKKKRPRESSNRQKKNQIIFFHCPFKIEKMLTKSLKPKTVKKNKKKLENGPTAHRNLQLKPNWWNTKMETLWQNKNLFPQQFPEYMERSCKKPHTFLMYIRWNQSQLTRLKCHGNLKNTN